MMTETARSNSQWFAVKPGSSLLSRELQVLNPALEALKQGNALLLGPAEIINAVSLPPTQSSYWRASPGGQAEFNGYYAGDLSFSSQAWPFVNESLDLIILAHGLGGQNASRVLDEAWRVLAPEGHLIVTAIHLQACPFSITPAQFQKAIAKIPAAPDSDQHYGGKLGFNWSVKTPEIIHRVCPLHIIGWQKHKPGRVGRVKFSLPDRGALEYS